MDTLIGKLAEQGVIAVVLGIMIWCNIRIVSKLFSVIENNTTAMTGFKASVDRLTDHLERNS